MAGHSYGGGRPSRSSGSAVLVAALVLALSLLGACSGADDGPDPPEPTQDVDASFRAPSGILLARPSDPEEDNTTFAVFLDLVRNTPVGERIRILAHSFSFVPAAEALIAAHQRGVRVQVVVDRGVSGDFVAPGLLRDELGTARGRSSFIYFAPGDLHQKTWSFTRTGRSRDVVLVGSMNLTYQSARQYTDVVSYVGRRDVRRAFDRRFVELVRDLPDARARADVRLGRDRAWFFPGYDAADDPLLAQLAAVPAPGARIRVVMYAWLDERGLAIARLLADKAAAGADVEVILGPSIGEQVRTLLVESPVVVRPGVFADGDEVHHKLTLVRYPDEPRDTRFVLTGSDNFTTKSLDRPEVLLRLDGSAYGRYDRWVDRLVARGRGES
ncbi:MAG: hypothetical protein CMJ44_16670 [Pimelobacter sp.]|nr:hypothetical protein [Pimelobacter sp.]